jgi:transposase
MRFYLQQHRFYCGVDLHARTMCVCILDADGTTLVHEDIAADPQSFLQLIAPYRAGMVVSVECTFGWYWLADLCHAQQLPFVLGHALYMRAIHGGKAKNDRIDSEKIARLLRGGNFPLAYAYPKGMRETRDLLRRRLYLVRQRAALLTHVRIVNHQYNLPPLPKRLSGVTACAELKLAERFGDPVVRQNVAVDLALADQLARVIRDLERSLVRTAQVDDAATYARLQTVPGIGKILALVLLYEMHEVNRFGRAGRFLSYARLVRCDHESGGKKLGTGGAKIGNAYLKWAFAEGVTGFVRLSVRARRWKQKVASKRGAGKAMAILAARLGRAIFQMLRKQEAFDEDRFWNGAAAAKQPAVVGASGGTGSSSLLRGREAGHAGD